jgi:two-component system, response regulator PdtaR
MRRYLLVDDNAAFAENLAEILALLQTTRYDAIVSDMRMPAMGGAELIHRVRAIDPTLPAIVITAYTADNDLEAARREGLVAVLSKPVPIARLVALLGQARRDGLVALVEDDSALADNLTEALRGRGFAAITAQSVLEAENLGVRPFVGIVDLRVPGGPDGEAMRRLAATFPGLPLVVITALDTPPALPHAGFFEKPFDTGALLDAVERLYRNAHA